MPISWLHVQAHARANGTPCSTNEHCRVISMHDGCLPISTTMHIHIPMHNHTTMACMVRVGYAYVHGEPKAPLQVDHDEQCRPCTQP